VLEKLVINKSLFSRYFLVGIVLQFVVLCVASFNFTIDDSYISLRYGKNLAEYGQLAFNIGEPSEGYTNFLLVIIESLLFKLNITGENVVILVKILSILTGIAALYYSSKIMQLFIKNERMSLLPAFFLSISTPFVFWAIGGLETVIFTFFIVLANYMYLKAIQMSDYNKLVFSEIVFFVSILTRPEGLIFWIISLIHFIYVIIKKNLGFNKLLSKLMFLIPFTIYIAWKMEYFGGVLPLTYFAKEKSFSIELLWGGILGVIDFFRINTNQIHLFLIVLSIFYFIKDKKDDLYKPYLIMMVVIFLCYIATLGPNVSMGDIFRLFVPILPFVYILSTYSLYELNIDWLSNRYKIALIILLCTVTIAGYTDYVAAKKYDLNFGSKLYKISANQVANGLKAGHIELGKWLKEHTAPGTKIVLHDAGAIPFYSELYTIDTWSLVTPEIVFKIKQREEISNIKQKEKINGQIRDYIFSMAPEIIIQDGSMKLMDDSRFKENYHKIDKTFYYLNSYPLNIWVKNDYRFKKSVK
jgi:hypothetical protein